MLKRLLIKQLFEKYKKFNGFKCKYSVRVGINKMLKDFSKIKLNKKDFSNKKFYR